jgi:hypothetical protein
MTAGELRPASYRDLLTRTAHLKKVLGNVSTSNLTVPILDEAIRSLPAKSARSVWNYRVTLRSFLSWGRDRNLAPANTVQIFRAMSAKGDSKKDAEKIDPSPAKKSKSFWMRAWQTGITASSLSKNPPHRRKAQT